MLTGRYNRVAKLLLTAVACAPQTTVENDELTLSHADLLNPDFEKNFKFDATSKLRHIGVWGNGKVETEEIGLVNEQGTLLDDTPQFITPVFTTNTEGKTDCDVYLSGDPQCNYNTGTYYDIIRCRQPWKYNGKTYNPVCADMKFKIVIK